MQFGGRNRGKWENLLSVDFVLSSCEKVLGIRTRSNLPEYYHSHLLSSHSLQIPLERCTSNLLGSFGPAVWLTQQVKRKRWLGTCCLDAVILLARKYPCTYLIRITRHVRITEILSRDITKADSCRTGNL
jgi:hypothetical protein